MKLKLLFLLTFCIAIRVTAQQFSIYHGLTTSNGLPSNYIFSVCEDEQGFLWAGTDKGLCRYNGFNWQVWDTDNGLPGNYINSVYADKRGGLWLNVSEKGLYHFAVGSGRVTKVVLPGAIINLSLQTDTTGDLFAQVALLNNKVAGYALSPQALQQPLKLFEYQVKDACMIWADPVAKTLFTLYKPSARPFTAPIVTGNWSIMSRSLPPGQQLSSLYFANNEIAVTNNNCIWYSPSGQVLQIKRLFADKNTYAVTRQTSQGYYISNILSGYYYVDKKGSATFYNSKSGLGCDYVNQVYELRGGTIVFATLGGGLQFKRNDYQKSFLTGDRVVRSIVSSPLSWFILAGEKVFTLNRAGLQLKELGSVSSTALNLFVSGEKLLIGSLKGIEIYNSQELKKPEKFISFNAGISSIIQQGSRYLASSYGGGLISFDEHNDKPVVLQREMPIIEKTIAVKNGYALLSYEDGMLLVDTVSKQSLRLSKANGLLSNSIHTVYENADTLFIGTKAGLNIFAGGKVVRHLSYKQGFVGSRVVYSFHDSKKQLWVVSDRYLHLSTGKRLSAITSHPLLTDKDDLVNTAAYDAGSGLLATGSIKNFSILSLQNVVPVATVTSPRLLRIEMDGKAPKGERFTLPYNFNSLVFHVAPFATSPLATSTVLYRLHGRDEAWKEMNDSLAVSFTALRPGSYRLMAKMINPDGYESSAIVLASFTVAKPFWQTWWFVALIVVLTICTTMLFMKRVEAWRHRKQAAALLLEQSLRNERERISKDLHDHLGSNLVTMVAQVDTIENKLHRKSFSEAFLTVQQLSLHTREVMNVLRETIWAVQENEHTLESFGLRIRTFLQRTFEPSSIVWHLTIVGDAQVKLSPKQTLQVFRMIQEATQNIIKHSKADKVNYTFSVVENSLQVTIADNGIGLKEVGLNNGGNGMLNMTQRAAELGGNVQFSSEAGTIVRIEIKGLR